MFTECAPFLTEEGKKLVDTVKENELFQKEVLKAAEALKQHSIDEQGWLFFLPWMMVNTC